MSKFTCLVLCAVAVSISSVYAEVTEEEKAAFRNSIKPALEKCSKEFGVTPEDIKSAKAAGSADGVNSCFIACVFKEIGVITEDGLFNLDAGLNKLKDKVHDKNFEKLAAVGKQCASINDAAVSDGTAGCERAKLLVACAFEHNAEIPI